jgi:hypothetical protein
VASSSSAIRGRKDDAGPVADAGTAHPGVLGCGNESARSIPLGMFTRSDHLLATARGPLLSGDHSVIGVDDAHLLDHLSATQHGGLASPN